MQYRRFRAPDMHKAIRKIRDAVGPDAVILSNKKLPSGEVEIVTVIDYDGSVPPSFSPSSSNRAPEKPPASAQPSQSYKERIEQARNMDAQGANEPAVRKRSGDAYEVFEEAPAPSQPTYQSPYDPEPVIDEALSVKPHTHARPTADEEKLRAMEEELHQVRELLERSQAATESAPRPSTAKTPRNKLQEQLVTLGLSERVIDKIASDLQLTGREEDWKKALSYLADCIPVRNSGDAFRGCIAFMGPTGVGKTTSIGKIAAQYVLKHGPGSVALVTTDTYRIAAHEQLRTFGRILGVPVEVVNEYSDLNEVLDKYSDYSLVLVDTAGMNPRDRNLERQLAMMKRARGHLKKLLVLPCTSQRQVLKTVVDVYSQVQLDGCVLSKLDESASLGEAISVVIEEGLPVMYVADGQRIPDDIEPARAHNLISRAVYTAEQFGQLYGSLKYGS